MEQAEHVPGDVLEEHAARKLLLDVRTIGTQQVATCAQRTAKPRDIEPMQQGKERIEVDDSSLRDEKPVVEDGG